MVFNPTEAKLVEGDPALTDVREMKSQSLRTDDATHNQSFTDPNGNTYNGVVGALAAAGYSSGDFLTGPTSSDDISESTSSDTYNPYGRTDVRQHINPSVQFPGGVQIQALVVGNVDPSTDQIDVRIRNITDDQTVVERTGITGSAQSIALGPSDSSPATTSGEVLYDFQFRNGDNSTTVTVNRATLYLGVKL